ncbi:YcaO-like family protein, partial [Bacillus sp. NPDC060175]|uniref:YcaO-like family protein n=1 Tax=Bacillus sp. NPDC060175 TaxID=3347061 RepID=UPI0036498534
MNYNRHKMVDPKETINKIKVFLKDLQVNIKEHELLNTNGFKSQLLQLNTTPLFVNGKGTTDIFTQASAYGELTERILSSVLFRFNYKMDQKSIELDRNLSVVDSLGYDIDFVNEKLNANIDQYFLNEIQKYYFKDLDEKKIVIETYEDYFNKESIDIPVSYIDAMYTTNGIAFGNTLLEAKIQGLSEVFERYANRESVINRMTLPMIENWERLADDKLVEKINQFKDLNELEIEVRSVCIKEQLPVVCVIVYKKNDGKYFVKFGAHFSFTVALERCFTELMQGRKLENDFWKARIYPENKVLIEKNLEDIMKDGDGYYPPEFFNKESIDNFTYEFGEDNDSALFIYEKLLLELGNKVYFKDYSYKGFNVCKFIVPDVSNVNLSMSNVLQWYRNNENHTRALLNFVELDKNERMQTIKYFKDLGVADNSLLTGFIKFPISYRDKLNYLTLSYLKSIDMILSGEEVKEFAYSKVVNSNYNKIKELLGKGNDKEIIYQALSYPRLNNNEIYIQKQKISFNQEIKVLQ